MKHAFLIIAHNEYPVLEVLLSMLDDERNDIYLHIDKRATELFQQIKKVKMQKAGFYLGTVVKFRHYESIGRLSR